MSCEVYEMRPAGVRQQNRSWTGLLEIVKCQEVDLTEGPFRKQFFYHSIHRFGLQILITC